MRDYIIALNRYKITASTPNELEDFLLNVSSNKLHKAIRNFLNFLEEQDVDMIGDFPLKKWRKKCFIPRKGVREVYIRDEELRETFEKIQSERLKLLFKLLVYSGIRLKHLIAIINNFDPNNVVKVNDKVSRYPAFSASRGVKRSYWLYFPSSLEVKRIEISYSFAQDKLHKGRVSAGTIRKWNFNFLIKHGIPESVADFIQGRASTTVGSAHYLAKTVQADEWYSRVVDKLTQLIPP